MLKKFAIVLILVFTGSLITAGEYDSLINEGNAFYNDGLYHDAINAYQEVLDKGYESPGLYYNMGNAYYKLNDLPSAILYYEKAKKLDPDNKDILFNLRIVNSKIPDKIEAVPELFYKRWLNNIYNRYTPDMWAKIAIGLFILTLVFFTFFILSRKKRMKKIGFWIGLIFLLITILSFGMASQKYYYSKAENEAVIFTPTLTVKSAPNANSVDLFVIHEGTKVEVTDEVGEWYEIKIANGSVGWLPKSSVRTI